MNNTEAKDRTPQGYMLGPADGEHLVHWRDGGQILIKACPSRLLVVEDAFG